VDALQAPLARIGPGRRVVGVVRVDRRVAQPVRLGMHERRLGRAGGALGGERPHLHRELHHDGVELRDVLEDAPAAPANLVLDIHIGRAGLVAHDDLFRPGLEPGGAIERRRARGLQRRRGERYEQHPGDQAHAGQSVPSIHGSPPPTAPLGPASGSRVGDSLALITIPQDGREWRGLGAFFTVFYKQARQAPWLGRPPRRSRRTRECASGC